MAERKRIGKHGVYVDLSGLTFSRWTVLRLDGKTIHGGYTWLCRCECGTERCVSSNSLRTGNSNSCGCINLEKTLARVVTHGMTKSPEYQTWADMKTRCLNVRHKCYADYGGRGITVCDRWLEFENFYADMGPRPSKSHSLDRKDNDGNYEPDNCRWATKREQSANTRRNHRITVDGLTLTVVEWARRLGISEQTIHNRLCDGWSEQDAVFTPINKFKRYFRESRPPTKYT